MQTTLLGFAIAVILALLAALVGPLFVDWGSYRAEFEEQAGRLTGLDVRVTGAIDARLLPTPILVLQGVEFGRDAEKISARALRVEFSLGALVRGEWRITDAQLDGPQVAAGVDISGQMTWPVPKMGFDPEAVAIERLTVRDGRATLTDAASGSRLVLDKLEFKGELRSLAGPIKGAGSFVVGGRHLPYRVSTGRIAEDTPARVRLAIDPIDPVDRPLTAEADISIWIDHGAPRFEGSLNFARAVGRAQPGTSGLITESWRATSRISGDSATATLDQIEFQYGPEERATKLRGNGKITFGQRPEIVGTLSATQVDLDRILALPETAHRRPLTAIKSLAEAFTGAPRLPIPATLTVGLDSVTLGGAVLQRVGSVLRIDGERLEIKTLEVRAPGVTQVVLKGQLGATPAGVEFKGSSKIESGDPRALLAWLTDRSDAQALTAGPLRLAGDVTLGNDGIKLDKLSFELDRVTVAGRFDYAWSSGNRPARLDAELTTPEIDLDRVHALTKAMLGETSFDWPREGALTLKIGRAALAGVEARQADVKMRIDANGIEIDQLAIADFGGAALRVKGRIDTKAQAPRGMVTLDLDARALDGALALIDKFAPQAAAELRRVAARVTPVSLRAVLSVDPGAAGSASATAKYKVDGRAGGFKVALQGNANTASDAFKIDNLAALGRAKVNVSGRLDVDDGAALVDLVGLDRLIVVDKRPGRLQLMAKGALDGELAIDGQLLAGALNLATVGTIRLSDRSNPSARLDLRVDNANIRSPRPAPAGRLELLPTSATGWLTLDRGSVQLTELKGTVAGSTVAGRLTIATRQQPIRVDGELEIGALDLPAAVATAIRIPGAGSAPATNGGPATGPWPAEPFEAALTRLTGEVALKASRVALTPKLAARDVKSVLRFEDADLNVEQIDGTLAGGRVTGELKFLRRPEGLTARSHVKVAAANAAELLPGDGAVSGQLTLDLAAEGAGMSAVALVGSLAGSGSFALENGRLARLDPAAFDAVIRAVDQGLPIDAERVRERMTTALGGGGLAVARAEGTITINSGQARLTNTVARSQGADLAVSGSINLADASVDARLTLLGVPGPGAPANTRPEVMIGLKGPLDAPKRTIDVAALTSWLALRAVEQQSQKLDLLEGREPPAPPVAPAAPVIPAPSVAPAPSAAPTASEPPPSVSAAPTATAPPATARSEPDPAPPRPLVRNPPNGAKPKAPVTDQAQPQPLDIRPGAAAPTTATRPPKPPNGAGQAQAKQPAAPSRPRSLSEFLFGN